MANTKNELLRRRILDLNQLGINTISAFFLQGLTAERLMARWDKEAEELRALVAACGDRELQKLMMRITDDFCDASMGVSSMQLRASLAKRGQP